jgi:hypothetical protein
MGHYSSSCPEPDKCIATGTSRFMAGVEASDFDDDNPYVSFQFMQYEVTAIRPPVFYTIRTIHQNNTKVPQNWIPLDNQSTVDVFSNKNYLRTYDNPKPPCILNAMPG